MITVEVHGVPKAQPRVRAFRRGNHAGVYDPGTADDWKTAVYLAACMKKPEHPFEGAVVLSVMFRFPRPKSHLRKDGSLKPSAPLEHTQKPDLDNLVKAVKDAMANAGYWRDDAQVTHYAPVAKAWADEGQSPGVRVAVGGMDTEVHRG